MSGDDNAHLGPTIENVLCFIINGFGILDSETIMRLCDGTFSDNEIETAKDLLFGILHDAASSTAFIKRRSTNSKDTKKQKNIQDIYLLLQEKGTAKIPQFVALDLSRLPPITFDSIDVTSLLVQLQTLKTEVDMHKNG